MRAAVCHEYGPPESVRVEEWALGPIGAGQVRLRLNAAAVNFPDVLIAAGQYQMKVPPPFVPGSEYAGEVVELGEGVTTLALGGRVFGTGIVGAFAEEAVVPATSVTKTPPGIDDRLAAAFGVAHRTAYHVLRSTAHLRHGDELVVLGAGGGVGLAAVQLGVLLGARVTAVASSAEKLAVAEQLGATTLIDHKATDLRQALKEALPQGADVVVDPVGGDLSEASLRAMRWGGRFVSVGFASGTIPKIPLNLVLLKGMQILGFQFISFATNLPQEAERNERELMELFAAGKAFPHLGATFALDDAPAALRYVADGKAIGKVVIDLAPR